MEKKKSLFFANVVLGSTVMIFILAIYYIWYKSNSLQIPLNLKLVVFLIAGLSFSIIALYIRYDWKINFAIAIFSTVLAIYSVEFVLFVRHNIHFSPAEIDKRSKFEVLEDLRAEGVDAWPVVLPFEYVGEDGLPSFQSRLFPLGGISNKTVVFCNESGQYSILENDEHGFNNPKELYREGIIKVALVGDSFVQGACVQSGEDIASQLRNVGINALNLGNSGNGPLLELASLKEYIEPVRPEIVLWVYCEANDLEDLEKERKASMLMRYFEEDYNQNLLERQDEIDTILMRFVNSEMKLFKERMQKARKDRLVDVIKLWNMRHSLGLLNIINQTQKPEITTNIKKQLPLFSEILATAYQRSSGWGGKVYFVYLSVPERFMNNNKKNDYYRDDVLAIVNKLGIPLIDLFEVINKHPDPLSLLPSWIKEAHYGADGYKLIAESIASRLMKDEFLSEE